MFTEEQKKQAEKDTIREISLSFKNAGHSFELLDSRIMELVLLGFQAGIHYWENKNIEYRTKIQTKIKQIQDQLPF